jgi:hypothetical protein
VPGLALNEECRKLKHGFVHFLPESDDHRFGYVCDLIFTDYAWSPQDTSLWDTSTWLERIDLSGAFPGKDDPPSPRPTVQEREQRKRQQRKQQQYQAPPTAPRPSISALNPATPIIPIRTRFLLPLPPQLPTTMPHESNILKYHPSTGPPGNLHNPSYTRSQADCSSWPLLFDAGAHAKTYRVFGARVQAFEHRAHCRVKMSRDLRFEEWTPVRDVRVVG